MNRRSYLTGLIAAPAIVPFSSLMPIRGIIMSVSDPYVSFQSWPIGGPLPHSPHVCGFDLLSRARKLCEITIGGDVFIRPSKEGPPVTRFSARPLR